MNIQAFVAILDGDAVMVPGSIFTMKEPCPFGSLRNIDKHRQVLIREPSSRWRALSRRSK